ncbi:hypothetical protein [Paenibacillus cymbidii]|uniref:hypothetical protein n=1 Tax=Paenibacillus cymbidii TaxID=1639034 RepID=UPI001A9AFDF5|nr:hypothetical protein [Paenibacillus cymbidii]
MYEHYIRINADGIVIDRLSSAEERTQPGDILYASGDDVPRQFTLLITNMRGQFIYRWDGALIERSQQELDDEWAARPPNPPTPDQRIAQLEQDTINTMLAVTEVYEILIGG